MLPHPLHPKTTRRNDESFWSFFAWKIYHASIQELMGARGGVSRLGIKAFA
jgi:hypothetical protein